MKPSRLTKKLDSEAVYPNWQTVLLVLPVFCTNWFSTPNMNVEAVKIASDILVGIATVLSVWVAVKALRKSDWNSAMSTSPSLVLRPDSIWVGTREDATEHGFSVVGKGQVIKAKPEPFEIVFSMDFECFNAGRGVAFNISQPTSSGMSILSTRIPLYQTLGDEPFCIKLQLSRKFQDWYKITDTTIAVNLEITYSNDQNNVFCRSTWQANVRPFDRDKEDLKVREIRLLNRKGKVEHSTTPYKI